VVISQEGSTFQSPDALAAVTLHTLVIEGREGMTHRQVALACQRDPTNPPELREIEAALQVLLDDDLAECEGKHFKPTRAAIRAAELSF
jgi:hypothetical protein